MTGAAFTPGREDTVSSPTSDKGNIKAAQYYHDELSRWRSRAGRDDGPLPNVQTD